MSPRRPLPLLTLVTVLTSLRSSHSTCDFPQDDAGWTARNIRGLFVFGSSLVDNGNNNDLLTLAKANYTPYGIDFPLGPSGRFTNGKNIVDLLGEYLGVPSFIPPFAKVSQEGGGGGSGEEAVNGVDYASGGSGILDDTGLVAGRVTSLNQQIKNFETVTLPQLENRVGCKSAELLANYMFVVGTGGNDYTLNYFLFGSNRNVSLQLFTANLTASLSLQLERLHGLGGRKFVLMSVYPIGCTPMATRRKGSNSSRGCVEYLNRAAQMFNTGIRSATDELNGKLPGARFIVVNTYKIVRDIIARPHSMGFNNTDSPCCEVKPVSEGGDGALCVRGGKTCEDRGVYVYFDGSHPTEAVNVHMATKAFSSCRPAEVYPFNVSRLSQL
ncbi:hypothetical protein MLD38_001608 [Melastoma candidum]|uniref:Uncharacterized protein n=1 Tax=Melastoma candidum TaxID=119954 RepID=A0ACB9SH37_9MYRT|nr:hypothetical protein MLD38_001608 [Melastoma candidum]